MTSSSRLRCLHPVSKRAPCSPLVSLVSLASLASLESPLLIQAQRLRDSHSSPARLCAPAGWASARHDRWSSPTRHPPRTRPWGGRGPIACRGRRQPRSLCPQRLARLLFPASCAAFPCKFQCRRTAATTWRPASRRLPHPSFASRLSRTRFREGTWADQGWALVAKPLCVRLCGAVHSRVRIIAPRCGVPERGRRGALGAPGRLRGASGRASSRADNGAGARSAAAHRQARQNLPWPPHPHQREVQVRGQQACRRGLAAIAPSSVPHSRGPPAAESASFSMSSPWCRRRTPTWRQALRPSSPLPPRPSGAPSPRIRLFSRWVSRRGVLS